MRRSALWIGGALNAICAAFHGCFPMIFRWRETLASLSPVNRAVTYALAFHATLVIAAFAYVSFVHQKALRQTSLGRSVCRAVAAFYVLRIVEEWTIFSSSLLGSLAMSALCALIAGLYLLPSMGSAAQHEKIASSP
jgi:hypothetical protein